MAKPRILITGAAGFVGPYLVAELGRALGPEATIAPTARDGGELPDYGIAAASSAGAAAPLDVTDAAAIDRAIGEFAPTHVVHLAGVSAIPEAGASPRTAWEINTFGTLTIADALLRLAPQCRLIFAGSGLVYGETARSGRLLTEQDLLAPDNDYAVTKAAADLALGALAGRGLNALRLRLFNHTGPGQTEAFVVPRFAAQIAAIEAGRQKPVLRVGNLDAARDFLDVRDVAGAYALAIMRSAELPPGLVLNVASGVPRSIRSVLDALLALSRRPIAVETDPSLLRPNDTPLYAGDPGAARRLLGWRPRCAFSDTLATVLAYWRRRVAA